VSTVLSGPELQQRLAALRAAVDRELGAVTAELVADDPVTAAMHYALCSGGKRLRPILCLAAAAAVDPTAADDAPPPARVRAASALEVIHTYSLVHDDLPCMDDDALRRGRPTVHRVHGSRAAMAAGCALIPFACRLLLDAAAELGLPPACQAAAVAALCSGAGAAGMVAGQLLDLEAEGNTTELHALRRIHALKTGALFGAALRLGALLGGAPPTVLAALGDFGERLGLAFQVTDDVLDETMDAVALGKTPGKDRHADKATFISVLGLDASRRAAAAEADAAVAGLRRAGIASPLLEALAGFAVDRDR
jgi:geranylgeranyl pyrophosphate synthase